MIRGFHAILFTSDAVQTRAFLRDTLGMRGVDAGEGWLIFALPPAEMGVHPAEGADIGRHHTYLMCDDIEGTMVDLRRKGVEFTAPVTDQGWGRLTSMRLPGGVEMPLYEPRHPTAIPWAKPASRANTAKARKAKARKAKARKAKAKRRR